MPGTTAGICNHSVGEVDPQVGELQVQRKNLSQNNMKSNEEDTQN